MLRQIIKVASKFLRTFIYSLVANLGVLFTL